MSIESQIPLQEASRGTKEDLWIRFTQNLLLSDSAYISRHWAFVRAEDRWSNANDHLAIWQ